jgi:hypothetical protein
MLHGMIEDEPFDLAAIKRRAEIRCTWAVGRIGDPVPWCRYCGVKLPGETRQEHESIEHEPSCPAPEAVRRLLPDFDALLTEVKRLRSLNQP